jgi:hypothetical protein
MMRRSSYRLVILEQRCRRSGDGLSVAMKKWFWLRFRDAGVARVASGIGGLGLIILAGLLRWLCVTVSETCPGDHVESQDVVSAGRLLVSA